MIATDRTATAGVRGLHLISFRKEAGIARLQEPAVLRAVGVSLADALEEYLQAVVQRSFPILPYDQAAAAWHGRQRAQLEEDGKTPSFVDGQIAAIAFSQSLVVVTASLKHFECYQDLDVVDWTR